MRLERLGGFAAIALLATIGSASAVPIPCASNGGSGPCTINTTVFTDTVPPAGIVNLGPGTMNARQTTASGVRFGSEVFTWGGGTAGGGSGIFAGSVSNVFSSPFNGGVPLGGSATQNYLAAQPGGFVTVTDDAFQGNTLTLLWGSVDSEVGKNVLVSMVGTTFPATITGAAVLASLGNPPTGSTNALVTISGLGNWNTFTANNTGASAFEFDPQVQVPEPASLALLGSALVGFGLIRRRRKSA